MFRSGRVTNSPPPPAAAAERLAGRHLYAGQFWVHFGHFLSESTARLWADPAGLDGIVFVPKRPARKLAPLAWQQAFLTLAGLGDLPVRILHEPTEVERLVVPGQGFGLGEIARGTPEMHALARRIAGAVPQGGGGDLYLSRSGLSGNEGSALCEDALEENLAASGYEIYHPQQHPLPDQIARYRAARRVVSLDGSALHLLGFAGHPGQRVAMIKRRSSSAWGNIARQLEGFCGITPLVVDAVAADWSPQGKGFGDRQSWGQLDFDRLRAALVSGGFIDAAAPWRVPGYREQRRAAMARGKGMQRRKTGIAA
ncbi:MAG: glycosyltransferase family 61 protein [Hasllibacter sp.]